MSKCREAYEQSVGMPWGYDKESTKVWQAAWNAATKNAVQVLREANENGTDPAYWAEAIEQEQCE